MKKSILLCSCMCFLWAARAQWSYGVKAGLNSAAEEVGSSDYSTSALLGFNAGVFGAYGFAKQWVIAGELFYSAEGTRETYKPTGTQGHINRAFLRLPMLIQYYLFPGTRFYVEAGPQIGYLLSSREDFGGSVSDIRTYYHQLDIDGCIGAGVPLDALLPRLGLNIRYAAGLSPLNKVSIAGNSLRSSVYSVGFNYLLSPSRP